MLDKKYLISFPISKRILSTIILENFKQIMKETTTIIISHRISSVKLANQIIVIEDGKITESGSHKTLLNNKKRYFKTYKRQIEKNK